LDRTVKISVTAGDVDIDLDGSTVEIEEMLALLRQDDTWSLMINRLKVAKKAALKAAIAAAKASGLPERGSAFTTLVESCSLKRKPDQVLGAIHYLREIEGVMDSPPRVINQLFEDAGMESPGNLSLYLNRLRERNFLIIPSASDDKNRFAVLSEEGRAHLDKRSSK
tara:strand:+ start:132 stop:632 length:501 start_codon:yes stop_codon:yes gene_type:complete